jgi:hypothetical protein
MARNISDIAREIEQDWSKQGKGVNYAAKPYLQGMFFVNGPNDKYFFDDGKSLVLYFLNNASSYRGEKARELKAELREIIK